MDPIEEYPDVLQNIEVLVLGIFQSDRSILDLHVLDAYDAAARKYVREAQGGWFKLPPGTDSRTRDVFDQVVQVCEFRLGKDPEHPLPADGEPLDVDVIIACLKRLKKSVKNWTWQGGRHGYLEYIEQFLPR